MCVAEESHGSLYFTCTKEVGACQTCHSVCRRESQRTLGSTLRQRLQPVQHVLMDEKRCIRGVSPQRHWDHFTLQEQPIMIQVKLKLAGSLHSPCSTLPLLLWRALRTTLNLSRTSSRYRRSITYSNSYLCCTMPAEIVQVHHES